MLAKAVLISIATTSSTWICRANVGTYPSHQRRCASTAKQSGGTSGEGTIHMQNDSIETLLLRHYGSTAQAPAALEEKLRASVRQEVAKINEQERVAAYLRQRRFSRRKAVRLVAMGTAGLSVLSVGM